MLKELTAVTLALGASAASGGADPTPLERDRKAILAMAGTYTVTFGFRETVALRSGYELHEPYHTVADVELIEILAQEPRRIELQHILIADGQVVKHWRQEWLYENRDLHEYAGNNTWKYGRLSERDAQGTWTQRVSQVDDGPRYQGYGRWNHEEGFSSWESNWTWRPLPRREITKRKDYDVVAGRNRHTLTHTGWVHEQDNYKLVVRDGVQQALARETGLNRYDHVDPAKADSAKGYWTRTAPFWSAVRSAWNSILVPGANIRLRDEAGERPLSRAISDLADGAAQRDPAELTREIRARIDEYLETSMALRSEDAIRR